MVIVCVIFAGGIIVGVLSAGGSAAPPFTVPAAALNSSDTSFGLSGAMSSVGSSSAFSAAGGVQPAPPVPATVVLTQSGQSPGVRAAQGNRTVSSPGSIEFFSNMTLRVSTPASAASDATSVAYSLGGYVAYSSVSDSGATAVIRVPAENYQKALTDVESLGKVVAVVSTSDDVTVKYTDLNATLVSLVTEQSALLRFLNESSNITTALKIESSLQQVNAEINSIQSEILQTKTLIDYATISVDFLKQAVSAPLSVRLTVAPRSGMSPLSVTFNAVVNGGVAPYVVNYNFGDGTAAEGQSVIHTFVGSGRDNVTVSVTDSTGNVTGAWTVVSVASPPATSSFAGFPAFVGDLFFRVVEGIVEVAVVVVPVVLVVAVAVLPFRRRLGLRKEKRQEG